ncbi:MAG: fasciclin domain-containing protein [Aequorivita antarctica]
MQFKNTFLLLFMVCLVTTVSAQKYLSTNNDEVSKTLGESTFTSNKTFYENIEDAPDFTILAKILKNDPSRKKLESQEMVTFFAISDEAFLNLSKKGRDSILGNSKIINSVLKYLAVPGRVDSYTLKSEIAKKGGTIYLKTLEGENLGVRETNGELQLVDSENRTATIIAQDFYHKNGYFHIIDGLIFPASEE